jgi:hypothetical protein
MGGELEAAVAIVVGNILFGAVAFYSGVAFEWALARQRALGARPPRCRFPGARHRFGGVGIAVEMVAPWGEGTVRAEMERCGRCGKYRHPIPGGWRYFDADLGGRILDAVGRAPYPEGGPGPGEGSNVTPLPPRRPTR